MAADHHIIRRQVLELKVPRRAGALNLQMQISSLFKDIVADQLAARFDALGLENAVLRIPKLEVDLGVIDPHFLQRDFVESCVLAIEKEVDRVFRLARLQLQTSADTEVNRGDEPIILSANRHQLEALKRFLKTGTLPAPYHSLSWTALEEIWLAALEKDLQEATAFLQANVAQEAVTRERLLKQWSPKAIAKLLELISMALGGKAQGVSSDVYDSAAIKEIISQFTGWPSQVWEQLPAGLLHILRDEVEQAGGIRAIKTDRASQLIWQMELLDVLLSKPLSQWPEYVRKTLEARRKEGHVNAETLPESTGPSPAASKEEEEQTRGSSDQDKQAVDYAGLVIVHSFLPSLFGHLDWLKGKAWKNKEYQERALHLLHYLAAGEENAGEHQMYLAKILCEWPANWAVDRTVVLSEQEKKEADELLEAVLKHWSALKSTSVHLLRDGFLQRPGLLHLRDRGWLLQVERKGQDLLLDKLPWGIGMIRLPWMKGELVVEW